MKEIGPTNPHHVSLEKLNMQQYAAQSDAPAPALITPAQIKEGDAETLAEVGVLTKGDMRSGTYMLRDFSPVCAFAPTQGLEILPTAVALNKYDWLREKYFFSAVPDDLDKITAYNASLPTPQGYYVHVEQGARVKLPCQAALYMAHANIAQTVHNIVILEENSELSLITGCITAHGVTNGVHFGITEQYIGKNATLTSTMIHSWGSKVVVRPRSGTVVEAGGTFVNNYISLRPAADIESNPSAWLNGPGASAKYLTVILGSKESNITTGGNIYLNAEDTSAELAHRAVCTGGRVSQAGLLIGNARCRAHVDCAGMMLDPGKDGLIQSVPGLKALHPEAQMSHEASIGRIAPEQVEYLQSRGIEEREAISMIIRGFLDADIEGLGPELDARIAEIAELAGHGEE